MGARRFHAATIWSRSSSVSVAQLPSVLAGIEAARERGVRLGRPAGVHTPVKVTLEQAAQVRRLSGKGKGATQIARAVGLSRPTVYRILKAA